MPIDNDKLVLLRRRRVWHSRPKGSYGMVFPPDWCRENGIEDKTPFAIYQVLDEPHTLVIRFEDNPNDS